MLHHHDSSVFSSETGNIILVVGGESNHRPNHKMIVWLVDEVREGFVSRTSSKD